MKAYYEHKGITIYHGDCREILPQLERHDLLLTDPPYDEVNRESGGLRNLDKGLADIGRMPLSDLALLLANAKWESLYAFCGIEQISTIRKYLVDYHLFTRLCAWEKSNPSPMNGERVWLSSLEACIFSRRSLAYFNEHCASPVWRGPTEQNQVHPTQKPLWLFKKLILASCTPGGSVVDPFCGSGTSLLAAKSLGFSATGIELEERYCEIAAKRLAQEVFDFV